MLQQLLKPNHYLVIQPNHHYLEAITLRIYLHNQPQQLLLKKTKEINRIKSKINSHKSQHNQNLKVDYLVRKHKLHQLLHLCLDNHHQVDYLVKNLLNQQRKKNKLLKIKRNNNRKVVCLVNQLVSHCLELFQSHNKSQNKHNNSKNNHQHNQCSKTKIFNHLQHFSMPHQ